MLRPSAEVLCAVALVVASSCPSDRTSAYEGEVIESRRSVDRLGAPIVVLTVGWRTSADAYEQYTSEYPALSLEARFKVGDCVLVRPYGAGVRLSACGTL